MKNYLKLRLPKDPIKNMEIIQKANIQGGYNLVTPRELLTDEVMDIFNTWGLKPTFVTLFGRNDSTGTPETRLIHADCALNKKGQWEKVLFGINWEVTGHENIFSWWDMSKFEEKWPVERLPKKYDYLNGVHYVKRINLGVPEGAVKIDETPIDIPTLVRTDLPHATVYNGPPVNRVGISVRFNEDAFTSWADVYEFFKKYSIDE